MPIKRIPLQTSIKTRDSSLEKDGLIVNGYLETTRSGQKFAVKRPGITLQAVGLGLALDLAKGAFYFPFVPLPDASPGSVTVPGIIVIPTPSTPTVPVVPPISLPTLLTSATIVSITEIP